MTDLRAHWILIREAQRLNKQYVLFDERGLRFGVHIERFAR